MRLLDSKLQITNLTMIGKLKGLIDSIDKDSLLLDVNGVGYVVYCSVRTLRNIPAVGEATVLIIETHVREDHIHLYGFMELAERDWFRLLTTVKGVGSKVALAILSVMHPAQISSAIAMKDKTAFTQASGVGAKLAERLLVELKDKTVSGEEFISTSSPAPQEDQSILADAISALTNLGYNRTEAHQAAHRLLKAEPSLGISDLIRKSLKELAK